MKDYPINSRVKYHFTDAVEIIKVIEFAGNGNKCSQCRFKKVALRHPMTGRIEEWGCRLDNIETGCGSVGNERSDKKQVFYIN